MSKKTLTENMMTLKSILNQTPVIDREILNASLDGDGGDKVSLHNKATREQETCQLEYDNRKYIVKGAISIALAKKHIENRINHCQGIVEMSGDDDEYKKEWENKLNILQQAMKILF